MVKRIVRVWRTTKPLTRYLSPLLDLGPTRHSKGNFLPPDRLTGREPPSERFVVRDVVERDLEGLLTQAQA
ncbi:MAG: hypothetical protein ACI82F_002584 [Planctomycetota bacterium]|jgi:hypothetical protein